jgi:hypothetical protein
MQLIKLILLWVFRRGAYQILQGRVINKDVPQKGRFSQAQVNDLLADIRRNFDDMLPEANLRQFPTMGNRQNLLLAVATRAAYISFVEAGIERSYATELIGDIAWRIYATWVPPLRFLARLITRDPQKQMNIILRIFLFYPFSEPGYQRSVWVEVDAFCTDWHRCVPHEYFEEHGTPEEMVFFNQTWCSFDWAIAQELVPGGWYERSHTLSAGDKICDMKWHGRSKMDLSENGQ